MRRNRLYWHILLGVLFVFAPIGTPAGASASQGLCATTDAGNVCTFRFTPSMSSTGGCLGVGTATDPVGNSISCPGVFPPGWVFMNGTYTCSFVGGGVCWAGSPGEGLVDQVLALAADTPNLSAAGISTLVSFDLGASATNPVNGAAIQARTDEFDNDLTSQAPKAISCVFSMLLPSFVPSGYSTEGSYTGVWHAKSEVKCDRPMAWMAIDYIDSWATSVQDEDGEGYNFTQPQAHSQGAPYWQPRVECGGPDSYAINVDPGKDPGTWVTGCSHLVFTWDMRVGGNDVAYKPDLYWRTRAYLKPGNIRADPGFYPPGIVKVDAFSQQVRPDPTADQRRVPQNSCDPLGAGESICYLYMGPARTSG